MRDNLDDSLKLMFGDEGGYSNVETDSGGPTKYGITHKTLAAHRGVKSVTAATVKALKIDEAEEIYRRAYWAQAGGDVLPAGLDYAVFDFGVNSGPPKAVKTLQKVLGTTPDGWVGTETLRLIAEYPGGVTRLITDYCNARMAFLRSLKNPKTGFPDAPRARHRSERRMGSRARRPRQRAEAGAQAAGAGAASDACR
jgi:lysozyme family protein